MLQCDRCRALAVWQITTESKQRSKNGIPLVVRNGYACDKHKEEVKKKVEDETIKKVDPDDFGFTPIRVISL